MSRRRQLAAIMFTDIVGYTSLMGEDEQKAFFLLRKNSQLQKDLIRKYEGTWIKELGDGLIASFYTATNAIFCAIALQQACSDIADLKLRIGIHLGEIIFEENDVFGDGVNIASRLQASAPISSIWISESVFNNIANKKEIKTKFIGEQQFKNVKQPLKIYEVNTEVNIGAIYNEYKKTFSEPAPVKSIAVLPFSNMSNDPEQAYFSDGIAEEILNSLCHLKDLKVAGRMSSHQFKGKNIDFREVGEKLGVSTVMEGSVRKQGNMLRVTAQLINTADGYHIWSERYDRTTDDIFAIQEEIALALTEKLKITLFDNDRGRINRAHTLNTEAYELYLKGQFYMSRRGSFILNAISCFEKAKEIDPDFALAYVGFADANLLIASYGLAPSKPVMEKAKQAAEVALKIDPFLSNPHNSLGYYFTSSEWNWPEAKKNFLTSLELNPNNAEAHYRYGWNYLSWVEGNFEEAIKHGEISIKLEPLSSVCYGVYSLILHTAGKFEKALIAAKTGIELDAYSFLCRLTEGDCYRSLGRMDEAINSYELATKLSNRHAFAVNGLIWVHCELGNLQIANSLMNELKERSTKEYIPGTFTALSAAHLNNLEDAFYFLNRAFDDREPIILTLKNEHWVPKVLKEDIRFQNLISKIGLPEMGLKS